jgi:hypothetical protein
VECGGFEKQSSLLRASELNDSQRHQQQERHHQRRFERRLPTL